MEASNKTLLTTLEKRLHSAKGKWAEELSRVLWAYRTTSQKPIGVSPLAFTYGMEAIIPIEIGLPTLRTEILEKTNTKSIAKDLDMADEFHEAAVVRIALYQQRVASSYNMHVKQRTIRARDLVIRKVFENSANLTVEKF